MQKLMFNIFINTAIVLINIFVGLFIVGLGTSDEDIGFVVMCIFALIILLNTLNFLGIEKYIQTMRNNLTIMYVILILILIGRLFALLM